MTRSVYKLCGFQNLKPVGFCVVCAFCGNYKQRRYKYKSLSPINCNLNCCHFLFWMSHKKSRASQSARPGYICSSFFNSLVIRG